MPGVQARRLLDKPFGIRLDAAALDVAGDIGGEVQHAGEALRWLPRHGLRADREQGTRDVRGHRGSGGRSGMGAGHGRRGRLLRRLAREHEAEDRTEGVDVRARIDPLHLAARLLGGHVAGRSENRSMLGARCRIARVPKFIIRRFFGHARAARRGSLFAGDLPHTPVHDKDLAERTHHHVLGLQVAMEHATIVRERNRLTDPLEEPEALVHRRLRRHVPVQTLVGQPPYLVDGNDPGMLEPGQDARFP